MERIENFHQSGDLLCSLLEQGKNLKTLGHWQSSPSTEDHRHLLARRRVLYKVLFTLSLHCFTPEAQL